MAERSDVAVAEPAGVVEVSVDVRARPATVFGYFTSAQKLRAWLGDGAEIDPVEGGSVTIRYPTGEIARGVVERIEPERSFTFTWGYEGGAHGLAPGSTRVTILLEPTHQGTRVILRHEGLPTEETRTGHRQGWSHYVSVLATQAAHAHFGAIAEDAAVAFVAAWNETDPARRAGLLERSFAENGTFRDRMAAMDGRAALDAYIAGVQRYMPGVRLVLTAQPDHVHDRVRFPWRFEREDGVVLGAGWDYGCLTMEGRFTDVAGFWDG
jgi:uncharacterized protein YndB with AHSA1/START domain